MEGASSAGVPGLRLRRVAGPEDHRMIASIADRSRDPDGSAFYELAIGRDSTADGLVMELHREFAGYGEYSRHDEYDGSRVYELMWLAEPRLRSLELERALLRAVEAAAREAESSDAIHPALFQTRVSDRDVVRQELVARENYRPVRYSFTMTRPIRPEITGASLPKGLLIREVRFDDMETIWKADVEAFRDHWGSTRPRAGDYRRFLADPIQNDTTLWRIAWEGDRVAGQVRSFINEAENRLYHRRRAWVEHISVGRPWRRRGLARALIAASLPALEARGMAEAALGVDTENTTGARQLYESIGFRPVARRTFFRKPL